MIQHTRATATATLSQFFRTPIGSFAGGPHHVLSIYYNMVHMMGRPTHDLLESHCTTLKDRETLPTRIWFLINTYHNALLWRYISPSGGFSTIWKYIHISEWRSDELNMTSKCGLSAASLGIVRCRWSQTPEFHPAQVPIFVIQTRFHMVHYCTTSNQYLDSATKPRTSYNNMFSHEPHWTDFLVLNLRWK